jgi:hypothetical protein
MFNHIQVIAPHQLSKYHAQDAGSKADSVYDACYAFNLSDFSNCFPHRSLPKKSNMSWSEKWSLSNIISNSNMSKLQSFTRLRKLRSFA